MKTNKEVAKEVIVGYLSDMATKEILNIEGYNAIYEIQSNDKILLEHIKAMKNIFEKAIKEIEND